MSYQTRLTDQKIAVESKRHVCIMYAHCKYGLHVRWSFTMQIVCLFVTKFHALQYPSRCQYCSFCAVAVFRYVSPSFDLLIFDVSLPRITFLCIGVSVCFGLCVFGCPALIYYCVVVCFHFWIFLCKLFPAMLLCLEALCYYLSV